MVVDLAIPVSVTWWSRERKRNESNVDEMSLIRLNASALYEAYETQATQRCAWMNGVHIDEMCATYSMMKENKLFLVGFRPVMRRRRHSRISFHWIHNQARSSRNR